MNTGATLILAGSGNAAPGSPSGRTVLLGLPLVRRAALAAERAGFDRVYVLGAETNTSAAVLEGTIARPFPGELPRGRIVLLADRVVASPQSLRSLRDAPAEPGQLYRVGSGALFDTADPDSLALETVLGPDARLESVVSAWAAVLPPSPAAAPVVPPFEVTSASEIAAAEDLLLKGLVKKEDGILTKLISRKVSLAVSRRLARTPMTPNAMTLVCAVLGLLAAWSFASPQHGRQVLGGALFLLHSILDGCDGELARLKFQESRLGGVLDFWGDNIVHVAVFSAFALAWQDASGESWPLVLGAMAVGGTILCAGFVYFYAMRPREGGGPILTTLSPARRSRLTNVLDALARRDFIYLVMVLALFGKAYWILAPTAVGTLTFFLALVVMASTAARRTPEVSV